MNEQTREQLEQLRGTANGEALKVYINEQIAKISDIKTLTPENVESRKKACEILELLFSFLEVKTNTTNKTKYN
jgi:CMP-2-keto-3-deoxyoctulosonic acid synthetase